MNEIRTIETDEGKILFCASDVAKMLGYVRPSDAIAQHCRYTVKHSIPHPQSPGRNIEVGFVPEGDVYRLIVRSKLPSAEAFEKWLFDEVVPSIRKKGFYGKIDRTALPNFIERYKDNYHKIPATHFSVISEMFARLYMALEKVGYVIPDKGIGGKKLVPDISVGRGARHTLKVLVQIFITPISLIHIHSLMGE